MSHICIHKSWHICGMLSILLIKSGVTPLPTPSGSSPPPLLAPHKNTLTGEEGRQGEKQRRSHVKLMKLWRWQHISKRRRCIYDGYGEIHDDHARDLQWPRQDLRLWREDLGGAALPHPRLGAVEPPPPPGEGIHGAVWRLAKRQIATTEVGFDGFDIRSVGPCRGFCFFVLFKSLCR